LPDSRSNPGSDFTQLRTIYGIDNNADNVIESFILISLRQKLEMTSEPSALRGSPLEANTERALKTDRWHRLGD
jgi:hypothetical protein